MKKYYFFDTIDRQASEGPKAFGALLVNDLSKKSEFMLQDWGLPIFRPKSLVVVKELSECLCETRSNVLVKNLASDDLVDQVLEKMDKWKSKGQETYFISVSFDEHLSENFCLRYSERANLSLLNPIEKNLSVSGQNFKLIRSCSNSLFNKIESSISRVSCLEISFGNLIDTPEGNKYSKERVFEEVLIFANLSFSGKI